jgi:hypothetical protein
VIDHRHLITSGAAVPPRAAMALEELVLQIQTLSGTPAGLDALPTALREAEPLLRANAAACLTAAEGLDPAAHTLGCLHLLLARGRAAGGGAPAPPLDAPFLAAAAAFFRAADGAQLRRAPGATAALARLLKAQALAAGAPKRGVAPLRAAAAALAAGRPGLVTAPAVDLLELCLAARCPAAAAGALAAPPTDVDPRAGGAAATDVLLFCYYGGLVEARRRRFGAALDLFAAALAAPTLAASAITLAALKKFLLVAVLARGAAGALPRGAPPPVARMAKAEAGPYRELARLAAGGAPAGELAAFAAARAGLWRADGNAGLVAAVLARAPARGAAAAARTHEALPLGALAARMGLPSAAAAEGALLAAVDAGEVAAEIAGAAGVARLGGAGAAAAAARLAADPAAAAARIRELLEATAALHAQVAAATAAAAAERRAAPAPGGRERGGAADEAAHAAAHAEMIEAAEMAVAAGNL